MLTEGFYIFYHIQLLCGIFSLFFYRFQSCSFQVNGQNVKVDVIRNLKNVIFSDNKITIMDNIVSENGKTLSFRITKPRFSDNAYLLQPLSDTTYLLQQI